MPLPFKSSAASAAAFAACCGLSTFLPLATARAQTAATKPSPQKMKLDSERRLWADSHLYITALGRTARALVQLADNTQTPITKPQAQQLLGIINAWRTKPTMSDDQAKKVNLQVLGVLSAAQQETAFARRGGRGGGPGGGGPGGPPPGGGGPSGGGPEGGPRGGGPGGEPGGPGGGPGGAGRGRTAGGTGGNRQRGGGGPAQPQAAPKDYNPLNPDSFPYPANIRAEAAKRMNEFIAKLQARAR